MPSRRAVTVIDASCLINLAYLELLPKLTLSYHTVYIPRHVLDEAWRKGKRKRQFQRLLETFSFLEICDIGNPYDAQLLYAKHLNPQAPIDRGEAEAIIQARERQAREVLIDDAAGRKIAERHSLIPKGTLRLLIDFQRLGVIERVRPLIEILQRNLYYRISEPLLSQALKEIGEQ